ncbi:MAG: hypothetical protein BWY06_01515 [Candidatus Latescibacteria bacterium ADurb.Bin168]|nr:MAG: hypothetical protein BWY06_01515 [Candidatus Latescibacteria bacterium ADurb.Bin168]
MESGCCEVTTRRCPPQLQPAPTRGVSSGLGELHGRGEQDAPFIWLWRRGVFVSSGEAKKRRAATPYRPRPAATSATGADTAGHPCHANTHALHCPSFPPAHRALRKNGTWSGFPRRSAVNMRSREERGGCGSSRTHTGPLRDISPRPCGLVERVVAGARNGQQNHSETRLLPSVRCLAGEPVHCVLARRSAVAVGRADTAEHVATDGSDIDVNIRAGLYAVHAPVANPDDAV